MGSYPRLGCGRRLVRRFGPEVDVRSLPAWEQILRVLLEALGPVLSFWTKPVLGFAMYF